MSEKLCYSRILQVKSLLESFHITRYFVHAQTVSTKPLFRGERSSFYPRTFLFPPSISFHNDTIERETFKEENFCKFQGFFFLAIRKTFVHEIRGHGVFWWQH